MRFVFLILCLEIILSNLISRILTAFVFGFIALYLTWVGGIVFFLFVWVIGGFILYEWVSITKEKWHVSQKILASIFYLVFGAFFVSNASASLIFCFLLAFSALLAIGPLRRTIWVFSGFLYVCFPVLALCFLRGHEPLGFWAVLFLFAIVWGTDIAGYFSGRAFGGPKLAPQFSPNKTWAGAIGGTFVGVSGGLLIAFRFFDLNSAIFFCAISCTDFINCFANE